eukprot:g17868.t1
MSTSQRDSGQAVSVADEISDLEERLGGRLDATIERRVGLLSQQLVQQLTQQMASMLQGAATAGGESRESSGAGSAAGGSQVVAPGAQSGAPSGGGTSNIPGRTSAEGFNGSQVGSQEEGEVVPSVVGGGDLSGAGATVLSAAKFPRVQPPAFKGDRKNYLSFRADFLRAATLLDLKDQFVGAYPVADITKGSRELSDEGFSPTEISAAKEDPIRALNDLELIWAQLNDKEGIIMDVSFLLTKFIDVLPPENDAAQNSINAIEEPTRHDVVRIVTTHREKIIRLRDEEKGNEQRKWEEQAYTAAAGGGRGGGTKGVGGGKGKGGGGKEGVICFRCNWPGHYKNDCKTERKDFRASPRLEANPHYGGLRSKYGAISVEIRLAVALRVLAGGSYLDIGLLFGVAFQSVYQILWEVIDAINSTPSVGPFFFPQTEADCRRQADRWQALNTNGVFANVVAAADGLLVKLKRLALRTPWTLSKAVNRLPREYCIVADAAYPLSDKILTPYPGKGLELGFDSFNFHLNQLRVRIEQSYGILGSVWGILWRPIKVQFAGRASLIIALFHLHNFLRDERDEPLEMSEEDENSGRHRPHLTANGTLPPDWQTAPSPSRSGETRARAEIRFQLEQDKQWRPVYNTIRNS